MLNKIFNIIRAKKEKDFVVINILTRTSGRPKGFGKCHESIRRQNSKTYKHIVSYDNLADLDYLKKYEVKKVPIEKELIGLPMNEDDRFEPYNLYCNNLLNEVEEGWIMFLDDDDMLADEEVLKKLQKEIRQNDEDTLFIWQTKFPDGSLLPPDETFNKKEIKLQHIDTACFMFHFKYKNVAKWDGFWAADFRFIKKLSQAIPNQRWIRQRLTLKNNFGDQGRKNDLPY